jgi:REP element-mobilizing transposase RayT
MSSYRQLLYHIVIRTKNGKKTIDPRQAKQLYAYIAGIIKNKKSHLYRINGIEDHIHILTDIHPSIALADFIRDIKVSTSVWMKNCGYFPDFEGWSDRYGAFTCSWANVGNIAEYIITQREHHKKEVFIDEYRRLMIESGITIDERYFP